jgi:hypothetical protein
MKIATLVTSFFLIVAAIFSLGAGPGKYSVVTYPDPAPTGNHKLSCTVIQPWSESSGPGNFLYPVIVWANGWCYNEVYGNSGDCLDGYKPGLIEWALDGPYIVVAANQWSVQESDVLACAQWITDPANSEYAGVVNKDKIGLAGHSQGGGAVIKAGDGWSKLDEITAVVAMNPYGPGWVNPGSQDGPVLLLGGWDDGTCPPDSYEAVWLAVQENDHGGINAKLADGNHNDDAWGPEAADPSQCNFGRYQRVTELWWQFHLNNKVETGRQLTRLLDRDPWDTEYDFDLY